jgi:tripartite ATP-independent transporter DctP family solute receptor
MRKQALGSWMAASSIIAVALLCAYPAAAGSRLISVVFSAAPQSPQQHGADALGEKLVALTGKRFTVDERGGHALGSESAVLAATLSGAVDTMVLSSAVVSSVVPELGVFDIPFLFRDSAHAKAVAEGPVGVALAGKFADKGLVLLAIGRLGFRNITNSKRPIRTPEDVKGLKIRLISNQVYQMTFKALGAEPVPMDLPFVYAALKDGRIDAEENPVVIIAGSHFQDVQKYLTLSGHFFSAIVFVANRAMFDRLDSADQAALITAAKSGAEVTWQEQLDAEMLAQLRAGGMDIIEKIDRQPFVDALKPLDEEFEKRFGKDTLLAIRSTP